jgi:hypothetical protein
VTPLSLDLTHEATCKALQHAFDPALARKRAVGGDVL